MHTRFCKSYKMYLKRKQMNNNLDYLNYPKIVEIRYLAEASNDKRIIVSEASTEQNIITKLKRLLININANIELFKKAREDTKNTYPKLYSSQ